MKFVPNAISRRVAEQGLLARKNSPTILFGVGVVSMVGSTILACRATLKLEEVLIKTESDLTASQGVRDLHPDQYSENDRKQDVAVIYLRAVGGIVKLYAPSIILGGVGIACLTKSHQILQERNLALTAAYVAVDKAFQNYRARVVDRYGEDVDRELRYEAERVDVIDEETGKVRSELVAVPGEPSGYARWFDEENANWSNPPYMNHNWYFLRTQLNYANDRLHWKGHIFLNEVYDLLGLSHTSAGAVVGWVYDRDNPNGDNYVDFGCFDRDGTPVEFFNGRENAILLDFNVDGIIWDLLDERRKRES